MSSSETAQAVDPGAFLRRLAEKQRSVQTLSAEIVQKRTSPLLAEPAVAHGKLYWQKPDRLRIDFDSPHPAVLLMTPEALVFYDKALEQAERIARTHGHPLWESVQRFTADLGKGTAGLDRDFTVSVQRRGEHYEMVLTPRTAALRRRLAAIRVSVHAKTELPSRIRVQGKRGHTTVLEFSELRVNPRLAPGLFRLRLPDTVEVTDIP